MLLGKICTNARLISSRNSIVNLRRASDRVYGARSIILRSNWDESKSRSKKKSSTTGKVFFTLLALMPIVSFGLGTWQVRRLQWKLDLISRAEDRLLLPPLELPDRINPDVVNEFDYRRVSVTGEFDHSKEMLVGPRLYQNKRGYYVVTPLKRKNASTLLIFRGWIPQGKKDQRTRPESLVRGEQRIDCLLHKKPQKNMFTPEMESNGYEFHFMDIDMMAKLTGAQPIFIEALMDESPNSLMPEQLAMQGVPIGGVPKVNYRNSHFQYILTWYGLSLFTSVMLLTIWKQRFRKADPLRQKMAHAKKWQ